jgi:hypothetical protein
VATGRSPSAWRWGKSPPSCGAPRSPVLDDLRKLADTPDVIHGHHHLETLIAALTFPGTPIVNFCHGWLPWEEMPLHHPAVHRYVAVDEVCVDRLVREEGIARDRVELLPNFVDLDRFRPRPPLPLRAGRALVLSNAATEGGYAGVIRAACQTAGIELDIVGFAAGNPSATPEQLLPSYDLVFAKGRTALEALAVGCAVVIADRAGAGPLVTPDNYRVLRGRNFGLRELHHAHDRDWYASQIAMYCRSAAHEVSARVRADAGMDAAVERLVEIYRAALSVPVDAVAASRAAAVHCCRIGRPIKQAHATEEQLSALAIQAHATEQRLSALAIELDTARSQIDAVTRTAAERSRNAEECERRFAAAQAELGLLRSRLAAYESLPTLRIRDALLRAPLIGSLLQLGARQLARRRS